MKVKAHTSEAKLSGADLRGANLSGADLRRVSNLTQEQIEAAGGDGETRLPPGLKRPEHWIS